MDLPESGSIQLVVATKDVDDSKTPQTVIAVLNDEDPLPLNPLLVLDDIHAVKPEADSGSHEESAPEDDVQSGVEEIVEESDAQKEAIASEESEEEPALRLAPLFSYDEDPVEDLEKDRDIFFTSQSLNGGTRSISAETRTPFGSTPPHISAFFPRSAAGSLAVVASGGTVVPRAPLQSSQVPSLPDANPSRSRSGSAMMDSPKSLSSPKTPVPAIMDPSPRTTPDSVRRPYSPSESQPDVSSAPIRRRPTMQHPPQVSSSTDQIVAPHASFLFMQLRYLPFSTDEPIDVMSTPAITRAISVLDYMHPYHAHKIGVLFVGPGQKTEEEILSNSHGSVQFSKFLRTLGDFVRLKDYKGYVGGLDTSEDRDGEFALRAGDELTEVVFHVAPLMPTRSGNDVLPKKRHIGNDNVVIVWDESGEYSPAYLVGEFNLVSFLITPCGDEYVRISVFRKEEDVGHFLPISLNQLVRTSVLGPIIMQTALDADRECQNLLTARQKGPARHGQGICSRLQQIQKIRALALQAAKAAKTNSPEKEGRKDAAAGTDGK